MADFPESYKDPAYSTLDEANAQKYGIPPEVVPALRLYGEKTDASKVSSAGARTPYQITPSTRAGAIKEYGIDPYLSPENASEVATLLVRDSLRRNNNDTEQAVREYHGGIDRKKWGPVNADYWKRVSSGIEKGKVQALSDDFGRWLKDNPAVPNSPKAKTDSSDNLSAEFGNWFNQGLNKPLVDQIPLPDGANPQTTPKLETTIGQDIFGAGEAALNAITGLTTGAAGMVGGAAKGIANSIADGTFGTQEGVRSAEQAASQGAQALTYEPKTQSGQSQAAAVGDLLAQTIPAVPLTGELAALSASIPLAARAAVDPASAVLNKAKTELPQLPSRVVDAMRGSPTETRPTAGTMASGGAAGTDMALQRRQLAQDLPVPIELTKGQETRDFAQQQFEREAAKNPTVGEPLRDRFAQQNENILKNFDAWIDQSGAEAPNLRAVGQVVDKALVDRAARDKAEIRVAYKNAEKAGELRDPVDIRQVINTLNESSSAESVAPVISAAKREAVRLGAAQMDDAGNLIPIETSLENAELLRRFVNKTTGIDPTNIKFSGDIKRAIDASTADAGGDLYRAARRLRENYANRYENRAIISKLLETKRGTNDRQVAFEDVFNHSITQGSLDDLRAVRSVLQNAGEDGRQAWRELQGQTLQFLKNEATKNVQTDTRGNQIVSAAGLNKAIQSLDRDGKLDFIFSKKGAQQLRDVNDLSKAVFTSPPGSVNHSNTASVIAALLDLTLSATSGIPAPIASAGRLLASRVKDKNLSKRINEALNDPRRKSNTK